jgi:hypothetical protein
MKEGRSSTMVARRTFAAAALAGAVALFLPGSAWLVPPAHGQTTQPAPQQRAFTTPDLAMRAFIDAVRAPGLDPLVALLGRSALDAVPPSERQSAEARRATGEWLAAQPFEIGYADAARSRAFALFGADRVQLPALLVRTPRGWVFDTPATIAAMRERRIGVNEANALRALRSLAEAQNRFRLAIRSTDGTLHYAARIRSSPGHFDGLVASVTDILPGPSMDFLNPAFARAEGEPGRVASDVAGGYGYRILTAQGPHAEGGARSFLVDGRLTEGYAVIAWPVTPGVTGLSTFIMDHRGAIYEQELGERTVEVARAILAFDPGPGWVRAEPASH